MTDIDPAAVQAMISRQEGRYEDALAVLVGLFARICKDEGFARDNLFIVMFEWGQLIQVSSPAREALARARDAQAQQLRGGDHAFRSGRAYPNTRFQFIADINDMLGEPGSTRALFLHMENASPEQARREAWTGLPALVACGDFARAERYLPDPLMRVQELNLLARSEALFPPPGKPPHVATALSNTMKELGLCLATLAGLGRREEADALYAEALDSLENEEMRLLAERELLDPGVIQRELAARRTASRATPGPGAPHLHLVQRPPG